MNNKILLAFLILNFTIFTAATHAEEANYKLLWSYEAPEPVKIASISEDGSYVITNSYGSIYYINSEGELLWSYKIYGIQDIAVSSDGSYMAIGTWMDNISFLNSKGELLWRYKTSGLFESVSISSDSNYIAVSDNSYTDMNGIGHPDNFVYFFNKEGILLWKYFIRGYYNPYITSISVSSDDLYVAAGSDDGVIYFFDHKGDLLWRFDVGSQVWNVKTSTNGTYIAARSSDGNISFLNKDGKLLWRYKLYNYDPYEYDRYNSDSEYDIAITSNGNNLAALSYNDIYFFNKDGELLWKYYGEKRVTKISVSSEGDYIVAALSDNNT